MTKKVFSVEKLKESMKSSGFSKARIDRSLIVWANKCDGLTEEEMTELRYVTSDNWMIEVDGGKENDKKSI